MAHSLLDTLPLPAAENLVRLYPREGTDKVAALADRLRQALGDSVPQEMDPQEH
jgi:hypothetical protein